MSHTAQAIHCLVLLARFHGVQLDPERLDKGQGRFDPEALLAAVKMAGLQGALVRCSPEQLAQQPLPAIALASDGGCFIVGSAAEGLVLVHDPLTLCSERLDHQTLQARWKGELVLVQSQASLLGDLARFDFSWFIPAIIRYRHLLGQVLLAAFALQLLALVQREPLFAGMAAKVEIKTDRRSVISYFLSPLQEYAQESLAER